MLLHISLLLLTHTHIYFKYILFADDDSIIYSSDTGGNAAESTEKLLHQWLRVNKLSTDIDKTKTILHFFKHQY